MLSVDYFVYVSCALFCIGLAIILTQKHIITVLMGIELLFNAAMLNLIAFSRYDTQLHGQIFSLFVLLLAAIETGVALVIAYLIYKQHKIDQPDKLNILKE